MRGRGARARITATPCASRKYDVNTWLPWAPRAAGGWLGRKRVAKEVYSGARKEGNGPGAEVLPFAATELPHLYRQTSAIHVARAKQIAL